jgi:hypothetical protein
MWIQVLLLRHFKEVAMPRAIDILNAHPSRQWLRSKERKGSKGELIEVSNSELRRWFQRNGVQIGGIIVKADDDVSLFSEVVLFPKSHRVTLGCLHDCQNMLVELALEHQVTFEQATEWWHGKQF